MNGQTGASGDPATYQDDPNVKFAIAPLYGERGFPSVCGERVAAQPTRTMTTSDRGSEAAAAAAVAAVAAVAAAEAAATVTRGARLRIGACPPRS